MRKMIKVPKDECIWYERDWGDNVIVERNEET